MVAFCAFFRLELYVADYGNIRKTGGIFMIGKCTGKENRKKYKTVRKKCVIVYTLLFSLLTGCGEKGKIQDIPTKTPVRQEENSTQAGGTLGGESKKEANEPLDGASKEGVGEPSGGASKEGADKPSEKESIERADKPSDEPSKEGTGEPDSPSSEPQPDGTTPPSGSSNPATPGDSSTNPPQPDDFFIQQNTLMGYSGTADTVVVPDNVTTINAAAFRGNNTLVTLILPEGVTTIEKDAFGNCWKLAEVSLPKSLKTIDDRAFAGESTLCEVVIPESVTEIGNNAFGGCPLSAVSMPKQDIKIWPDAFGMAIGELKIFPYSEGQAFEYNPDFLVAGTTLLAYRGEAVDVVIPDDVKVIGEYAFETRPDIVHVSLPDDMEEIGARAFFGCEQLKEVSMPSSLAVIGFEAFGCCPLLEKINLAHVAEIDEEAFMDCKKLESVELAAVKKLGSRAFAGSGVCKVDGLKPSTAIGEEIFLDTPFFKENDMWIVENTLLDGRRCTGDIVIPEGVEKIAERALYKAPVTSVKCPETLQEIGTEAFRECTGLIKISMGNSVISLGEYAFAGDTSLSDVRLSAGLAEIPSFAFLNCEQLWMLTIPEGCAAYGLASQFVQFGSNWGRTRLITVPPTKNVPGFLQDSTLSGDKIYTTELPDGSDWEEQSKRFGWSIECLELATNKQKLTPGEQYLLIFNSGAKADWHSENVAVVTVDEDGMLCAKGVGKTDVVAVIYGKEYRCEVEVVE